MKSSVALALALAAGLVVLGGAVWRAPSAPPPGGSPEAARLVRQLTARPGVHRRLAERLAEVVRPGLAGRLPAFLRPETVRRRSLEACHGLMALGPAVQPAVPGLLSALRGADASTVFYAWLVTVYSGLPAAEVMSLARQSPGASEALIGLCAGRLTTEDERLREFAWRCLEAAGAEVRKAAPRLRELAAAADPEMSRRAQQLLRESSAGEALDTGEPAGP